MKKIFYLPAILAGIAFCWLWFSGIFGFEWFVLILMLGMSGWLLNKGKIWGGIPGTFVGIRVMLWGIEALPHRLNMGNAGPGIEPTWENSQWYIWNTEIAWGIYIVLFFAFCGVYVLIKKIAKKRRAGNEKQI